MRTPASEHIALGKCCLLTTLIDDERLLKTEITVVLYNGLIIYLYRQLLKGCRLVFKTRNEGGKHSH